MLKIKKNISAKSLEKISLSGDLHISKLILLVSSLCNGISTIKNISKSSEINDLIAILDEFGIKIAEKYDMTLVNGINIKNWRQPDDVINIKNSVDILYYLVNIISRTNFKTFITADKSILNTNFSYLARLEKNNNLNFKKNYNLPLMVNGTSDFLQNKIQVDDTTLKYSVIFNAIANNVDLTIYENELKEEYLEHILRYYGFDIKEVLSERRNILEKNPKKNKEIYLKKTKEEIVGKEFFIPVSVTEAVYSVFLACLLNLDEFIIENVSVNELNSDIVSVLLDNGVNIKFKNQRIVNDMKVVDFYVKTSTLKDLSISRKRLASIKNDYPLILMLNILKRNKINVAGIKELRIKETKNYSEFLNILRAINVSVLENGDMLEIDSSRFGIENYKLNLDDTNLNSKTKLVLFLSNIALSRPVFALKNLNDNLLSIFPNIYNVLKQLNFTIEYED